MVHGARAGRWPRVVRVAVARASERRLRRRCQQRLAAGRANRVPCALVLSFVPRPTRASGGLHLFRGLLPVHRHRGVRPPDRAQRSVRHLRRGCGCHLARALRTLRLHALLRRKHLLLAEPRTVAANRNRLLLLVLRHEL